MATASITINGDQRIVDGGSSSDYLVLNDVMVASNSDLSAINFNAVRMTNRQARQYIFEPTSYVDFTDARLFLTNNSNGQVINTEFEGRIRVGSTLDPIGFCEIHFGDKDLDGYGNAKFPLFGTTSDAYVSCPNVENRIKLMCHLDGPTSSSPDNPNMECGVWIQNNRSGNEIRVSVLGASHTYGQGYELPDPNGFKPNGTVQCAWLIGSNVAVRDIEFRDGFVDWRPQGAWATPTRGVFVSETWMKFLGEGIFTFIAPLIFGNQDDSFQVVVGNSGQTGSYLLHGIWSNGSEGRLVYNNFMGLTWATQIAMYRRDDKIRMENHLQLAYTIIDSLAQPIQDAVITLYKKDPVYNSTGNDVAYSGAENDFDTTTDADGVGNIGNGDGDNANNICVEAFCGYGNGGNIDGAYANKDHSMADYDSNKNVYYTIIKWGKKPIIRTLYVCKLSGETGEGKQSLGVIQLENDGSLTAITEAAVPATITDSVSFYDNTYKYALNEKIALFCYKEGDTVVSDYTIELDGDAVDIIDVTGSTITVKTSSISSGIKSTGGDIVFQTASLGDGCVLTGDVYLFAGQDVADVVINGDLYIDTGEDSVLGFNNVTVTGSIYNNDTDHTLTINATGGSNLTAGDAGTGNGETNIIADIRSFSFTVNPSIINYEWRLYTVTAAGSLAGATEIDGEENATSDTQSYEYSYTANTEIAVQIIAQPDSDYVEEIQYYTLTDNDQSVVITISIDNNN